MKSLQELRSITKAEQPVEDTLAAVIMICKIFLKFLLLLFWFF